MAQINITLNQEEVLRVLADEGGEAFRLLLEESLNAILKAESVEQLKALPYERTSERTDSRNGSRERPFTTRLGTLNLLVPRHRNVPFKTLIFENYSRSESGLILTMAEMVVSGTSTAKVGRVMETICGKSFSKQTVSEACAELDSAVEQFRNRSLGEYLFVMVDATYVKVRENHRVVSKALMVAIGFTTSGVKEIIGVDLYEAETKETWLKFIKSLQRRGLHGMRMFTSDAHDGLVSAFQEVYPDVPWQRCQAHFVRNITDITPKKLRVGLRSELSEMFNAPTIAEARRKRDEIIADYAEYAPRAMECLDVGFEEAMTVMELPSDMRRCVRTSNYLERLNKEIKRRTKVIGIFPNSDSVVRLVGSLLMEENERWEAARKVYYQTAVAKLEEKREVLIAIARQQIQMRKAA